MIASCHATSKASEPTGEARLLADAEDAFRGALADSLEALELGERNLLRFHYFHGLTAEQLAALVYRPAAAVARQLARIRERMLRDVRRGLAARLPLDRAALDHLLELVRGRFDLAVARLLRG
jgi:RNA polymerase sigma-70 factor